MINPLGSCGTFCAKIGPHCNCLLPLSVRVNAWQVFGAFTNEEWKPTTKYYGNGECFVFQVHLTCGTNCAASDEHIHSVSQYCTVPFCTVLYHIVLRLLLLCTAQVQPELQAFRWTHSNSYFMFSTADSLAIGGGYAPQGFPFPSL